MPDPTQPVPCCPLGVPNLAGCPDCGLLQRLPASLPRHATADCRRCDAVLRRPQRDPRGWPLALALATLVLYLVAISLPLLRIDVRGRVIETTLLSLPLAFDRYDFWLLAAVTAATAVVLPLLRISALVVVLGGLRLQNPPRWLHRVYRTQLVVRQWAMVEVFLLGVFVAYTRLVTLAVVEVGPALWLLGAVMLTLVAADVAQDEATVWDALEARGAVAADRPLEGPSLIACSGCGLISQAHTTDRCPRCATRLRWRHGGSVRRSWALLLTAAILYVPANIYPVMTVTYIGRTTPHTILGGAEDLVTAGLWPLAILVFAASIVVPVLKLAGMGILLVAARRGAPRRLRDLMRLYRIVDAIGRWSMIDVFMLATLVGLVQAGVLATIRPGLGAVAFAGVVVLTMLAASGFDPRLIGDATGRRATS